MSGANGSNATYIQGATNESGRLANANANTDISKGVSQVILLSSEIGDAQRVARVIAAEAFVHTSKDADALNKVDKKMESGFYNRNSAAYAADLQKLDQSGEADHRDLGTNGNESYKGSMEELDKKDNTTYYTDEYKRDKKEKAEECAKKK